MKTADPIQQLASLSRQDREWIIGNLSTAARKRLHDRAILERTQLAPALERPDGSASQPPAAASDAGAADERAVEWLNGAQVAEALAGEPPWITATLLGVRPWPWESDLMAHITPVTRLEVSQLRLSAPRVSEAMYRLLLRTVRERALGAGLVSL